MKRIIDAHVHLYPPHVNGDPAAWALVQAEPHWALLATRRRRNGRPVQGFPSVDQLLHAMDAADVERAVLQGWYWNRVQTCAAQNEFYAACVRAHPDRLSAFAAFRLVANQEESLASVQRAHDAGFVGIGEISPHSQGYRVDDPIFQACLALAGKLRLPVNIHVTDPNSREYAGRVPTPLEDFVRLARQCPQTTIILAHWGGLLPLRDPDTVAIPNLYYDTAASPLLYDSSVWTRFLATVPSDRVLFGSDFPLNLYPRSDAEAAMARLIHEAEAAGFAEEPFEGIMRGNAVRLFGLQ